MKIIKLFLSLMTFLLAGELLAAQPAKLFEINGGFEDAVLSGDILFLAVRNGEGLDPDLRVFRMHDKGKATEIGSYQSKDYAHSLAIKGDYLYLIDGRFGLEIIDISNPAKPDLIQFLSLDGYSHKIVIKGNLAFVTSGFQGMHILDISKPRQAKLLSTFQAYPPPEEDTESDSIFGIEAYDDEDYGDEREGSGRGAVDMTWEDMITFEGALDVTVNGSYAYIAYGSGGMVIADISNPIKPVKVSTTELGKAAESIFLDHHMLYITIGLGGMHLIDVSHPETPKLVSLVHTRCYSMDVSVIKGRAFVADGLCAEESLYVISIADREHPKVEQAFSGMVNNVRLLKHAILAMGPKRAQAFTLEF